jgi:hypothetical protein
MKIRAKMLRLKTTLNGIPIIVIVNSILQPFGIITKPILLIPFIRQSFTSAFVSDNKCKDCEREEKNDEQEHDNEIEAEKPRDTTTSTYKPH